MNKIDIFISRYTKNTENMIMCISSEEKIQKLQNFNHHHKVSNLIDFIIENDIYCYIYHDDKENEENTTLLSENQINLLQSKKLFISNELAIEAILLKNADRAYDSIKEFNFDKKEIDNVLTSSWWLDVVL